MFVHNKGMMVGKAYVSTFPSTPSLAFSMFSCSSVLGKTCFGEMRKSCSKYCEMKYCVSNQKHLPVVCVGLLLLLFFKKRETSGFFLSIQYMA